MVVIGGKIKDFRAVQKELSVYYMQIVRIAGHNYIIASDIKRHYDTIDYKIGEPASLESLGMRELKEDSIYPKN